MKMRVVTYDGKTYSVRSSKTEIPDFGTMERMAVLVWLLQNTRPKGYSKDPGPNLRGYTGLKIR